MPYLENGTGHANTDTSEAAGRAIAPVSGTIRDRVLAALHGTPFPMTADEIAKQLELEFISVRPRLTELQNLKRVKDSGTRKIGRFGKQQIAWELA